ncbi:MAG: choice-of-anchor Q domain-containing protein, partial [Planctomycetota bacterium]
SNVVSSGWGGDGGYGGSGDLTGQAAGVDLTFDLLSNSPYPQYGGDGGDGGDAGDALGGGLRVRGGTLQLINSTVYQNVVVGGGGGDGGDGGVGTLGGGDAGNGGMGGDARGGGIYAVGDGTEIALVGSTVAANVVNAGPGGQGGKAGPIAADSVGTADAQLRVFGTFGNSLAVVTPDFSPFVDSSAAVITQEAAATDPILASFVQADQQASDGDVISADFYVDLATGIAIRTAAGVSGVAAGAAAVGVVVVSQFFTAVQATSLTATALSGTFLVAALPIGAVGALVTVGVVVLVKIGVALINGASFGEAVEAAIDVPDTGDGPNLATLFGGGNAGQTFVNQVFTGPGSNGSDGTGGAVSGSGIAGDVFLQRSLVADNSARGRQLTKTIEAAPPFSVPLINEPEGFAGVLEVADQTVFDIAVTDVDENSLILSDGRNLIGAAGGAVALANDLKGTVANPLDPMLQPALGMHGGDTPTLALLAGSPARDAISVAGSVTSQNGFVTTGTSSIGAWAGVDSQSLPGDYNGDLAVNAADYTVWRDTLGLQVTPFSGADADGNGNVGVSDFVAWKNSFGVAAAQGEASVVSTPTAAPGSASPPVVLELDPARPTAAAIDDAHEDGADAAPWFAAAASSQLPIGSTEDPLQATPQDLPANRERSHSLLLLAITTPDEPASDDAAEVVDDVSADEAFAELAELAGIGLDLAFA